MATDPSDGGEYSIERRLADDVQIYSNLGQGVIVVSEDRLILCLRKSGDLSAKRSQWQTPLCLFLSLLAIIVTCDTKPVLGISAETWRAFYLLTTVVSLIWLLRSGWSAFRGRKDSEESILRELKDPSKLVARKGSAG